MAFYNRIGSVLSQTLSQYSAPSMMNAVRCMSSKLFVGSLSWGTDDCTLKEAFSQYGEVVEARVITDRETGRSRGFGFVTFTDTECANNALSMDGADLQGRNIRVSIANERQTRPNSGYSGGGGYNNGGY
ncbi:unnamed protein product [Amaranthus hypochondriacus]